MGDDDDEDHHHHYGSGSKMGQMDKMGGNGSSGSSGSSSSSSGIGRSKSKTHGLGGETKGSDGHTRRQEKRKGVIQEAAEEEHRVKKRKPGVHRGNGWYEVENPHSSHGEKDKMYFVHYDTKRSAWKLPQEATEQPPGTPRAEAGAEGAEAGAPGVEVATEAEGAEGGVRDKGTLVDEGDSGGKESKGSTENTYGKESAESATDGKDVFWFNTDDESVEWCEPHSVTMDRPMKRRMFYAR